MTTKDLLQRYLKNHAANYYDSFVEQPVDVALRWSSERINSTLYEFELASGGAQHNVLVKIPFAIKSAASQRTRAALRDRPRLCPKPSTEHKSEHEYRTLSAIEQRIHALDDPRFGAVRILDLVPAHSALVMEKAPAKSLSHGLFSASRLQREKGELAVADACHRAGVWLRVFHQSADLPHTQSRSVRRAEFVESVNQFTTYLEKKERTLFFQRLREQLTVRATELLPESMPLGLSHGDYAPRNVLVDADGRVRIIDTLGRWRAPIYEDLSRFLCALHLSVPQVWTHGWAYKMSVLQRLEKEFLHGYFGDSRIPYAHIRLFECQALLDRWTSFVHTCGAARGLRRWAKKGRRWWWGHCFARHMTHTLNQISVEPTSTFTLAENSP